MINNKYYIYILLSILLNYMLLTAPCLLLAKDRIINPSISETEVEDEKSLLILRNNNIVVGILPHIGGRVVLLRTPAGKNVFLSDSKLWNEPREKIPIPSAESNWKAYNGQIVWLGPQSKWWQHQNINRERKIKKAMWPPDPYLIYGSFKVVEKRNNYVKMLSPKSPITDIQLIKEIWISENGEVKFIVTATNIGKKELQWSLWLNARVGVYSDCYVPVSDKTSIKINGKMMKHEIIDNFFHFTPKKLAKGERRRSGKAYISPSRGIIATFGKKFLFVQRFKIEPSKKIHNEQACVEIYYRIDKNKSRSLMELEHCGVFQNLLPGESMTEEELWKIVPYDGKMNIRGKINFLKTQIMGKDFSFGGK